MTRVPIVDDQLALCPYQPVVVRLAMGWHRQRISKKETKMQKEVKTPAVLRIEIKTASLKKVVEDGRLIEFAETISALSAQQIRYQLVEMLAESGVGLRQMGETMVVEAGFTMDGKYGTPWPGPIPGPWVRTDLLAVLQAELRQIVQNEMARM
jgi:hypothetical protein